MANQILAQNFQPETYQAESSTMHETTDAGSRYSRRELLQTLALALIAPGAVATADEPTEQPNISQEILRQELEASLGPLFDHELAEDRPGELRRSLKSLALYPTADSTGDSGMDLWEQRRRARLHQVVDALSRPDLEALARAARLLILSQPDAGLFEPAYTDLAGLPAAAVAALGKRGWVR